MSRPDRTYVYRSHFNDDGTKADWWQKELDQQEKARRALDPKPLTFSTVLGNVIGFVFLMGVLLLFGLAIHAIFGSYSN